MQREHKDNRLRSTNNRDTTRTPPNTESLVTSRSDKQKSILKTPMLREGSVRKGPAEQEEGSATEGAPKSNTTSSSRLLI